MPEDEHAECLFLRTVGLMRLGKMREARESVREMTDRHPAFMRGVALREVFAAKAATQGRTGLLLIGAGVAVAGLVLWWMWSKSGQAAATAAAPAARGGYQGRQPVGGLRSDGYSFGAPRRYRS